MFQAFILFSQPTGGLFKSFYSMSLTLTLFRLGFLGVPGPGEGGGGASKAPPP